jgi:pimeloyl-ACP methyl ester carboxylesterase
MKFSASFVTCVFSLTLLLSGASGVAFAAGKKPAQPKDGHIDSQVYGLYPKQEEACTPPDPAFFIAPPKALKATSNGRLPAVLRAAAKAADPLADLVESTRRYANGDTLYGNAFADLSVTGATSFARFKALHEAGKLTEATLLSKLDLSSEEASPSALQSGAAAALDRAYRVAFVLAYSGSSDRPALGYIAVSGEDDEPYRPVNVPGAKLLQHDLDVVVDGVAVRTRYVIAESLRATYAPPSAPGTRTLPFIPEPVLSADAKVLLYVHGMDSNLEEGLDLFRGLQRLGQQRGENWTLISMDLPTAGYATKLDYRLISPMSAIGEPRAFPPGYNANGHQNVPVLDFMENFVTSFVDTLDRKIPLKNQLQAVIGGSLGGNLTFRLARRTDLPWLRNVVTWSPASIWTGMADGDDPFKQIAVATAWKRAGGDTKNLVETDSMRKEFFTEGFFSAVDIGPFTIVPAQPDQWWRSDWPCFKDYRKLARYERREIYNREFRLWHWRLATEQLIFSQQSSPDHPAPRYLDNHVRMLLSCGTSDNFNFTDICGTTLKVAPKMVNTPGWAIAFGDTGHSIHNERPNLFATQIISFLDR